MNPLRKTIATLWVLLCAHLIFAQSPLFSDDSKLTLTIEGDLTSCINDRGDEREYHPISITWHQPNGDSTVIDMQAKVRGNFRRQKSTCQFPPLRLKMAEEKVIGTVFEGQKKLKLVTHCRGKNQAFEQKLFQEYLVYKSYNLLTDQSFRVRLVEITYVNTGKKPYTEIHHGFLIEDDEDLAERVGGRLMENGTVHPMQADQVSANRVALFMFMIGNTDWSIPNRHNIELVQPSPGTPPLVIPYDFDWSGVVDAPYAEPNPMLGLNSVKDRLFRGFCRPEESWAPVYEAFLAQKEAILALYSESTCLENAEKQRAIRYLEDFYSIIEDPRKRKMQITDMCRTDK